MGTEQNKDCVLEIEVVEFGFDILISKYSNSIRAHRKYFEYLEIKIMIIKLHFRTFDLLGRGEEVGGSVGSKLFNSILAQNKKKLLI